MESAGCASDAEQSAWAYSYSMTAECGPVKEEPEWGECGVSDAAAAEGLYADHEVKDELVFGPEEVQQQDIAFSMENVQCRMEEALCKPKSVGGAESTSECTHACPRDGHLCNRSPAHQYMLRSCFISLERLPTGDLHTSKLGAQKTIDEAPCKQQPVGGAGAAPESTHTRPGEGPRCYMSHEQLFQLRSCCVQLQPFSPGDLNTCETCLKTFTCKSSLKKHISTHSTEESYFKHEASDKQNVLKRHLVRHSAAHNVETGTEKQLKYSSDGDRLANTSYFEKKSKSQHRNESVLASHTGKKQSLFRCDICSKVYTQKQDLIRHVAIKHIHSVSKTPRLYKCDLCNKVFRSPSRLAVHNRVHSGRKPYTCDVCNKIFKYPYGLTLTHHKLRHTRDTCKINFVVKQSLTKRLRIHTGKKLFSCNFCNKQFAFNSNFARHIVMHTGEKPYSCSVCNKQFARKSSFDRHQNTHTTSEKLYSCDMCEKKFAFKHYLTTHIRIHTGEKPFSCDVCKKMFVGSSNLASHKIIHAREKPHSCSVCNKQFTHKSSFNRHKETHTTRENLYSCDTCEKKFARKQSLITHIRIHTGEKPFSCGVCKKQFAVSSRLARHKLIHTGEKPHSCSVCNKQFTRKSSVDIHKKKHTL